MPLQYLKKEVSDEVDFFTWRQTSKFSASWYYLLLMGVAKHVQIIKAILQSFCDISQFVRGSQPSAIFKALIPFFSMPPLLKFLFSHSFFSILPSFKTFYTVPPTALCDSQSTILTQHTNLHSTITLKMSIASNETYDETN